MTEQEWLSSEDPARMIHAFGYSPPHRRIIHEAKLRLWIDACRDQSGLEEDWVDYSTASGLASCLNFWSHPSDKVRLPMPVRAHLLRDIAGNPFRPVSLCGNPDHGSVPTRPYCPACNRFRTPTVLSLAQAAYTERVGRECEKCKGNRFIHGVAYNGLPYTEKCDTCNGTGRVEDGTLDPFRLVLVADALEEAGMPDDSETVFTCDLAGKHSHAGRQGEVIHGVMHDTDPRLLHHHHDDKCQLLRREGLLAHLRSPGPHYRGMWSLDLILGKE